MARTERQRPDHANGGRCRAVPRCPTTTVPHLTEVSSPPHPTLRLGCRIAISTKSPIGSLGRVGNAQRAAVSEAAALFRGLGHDVVERAPDSEPSPRADASQPESTSGASTTTFATMAHPERLKRRTRSMAWAGGHISNRRIAGGTLGGGHDFPRASTPSSTTSTSSSRPPPRWALPGSARSRDAEL